jgi:FtsZ-binding cell division protein ZapB
VIYPTRLDELESKLESAIDALRDAVLELENLADEAERLGEYRFWIHNKTKLIYTLESVES